MMDGLIAGRLHGQAEQRMGRNDKPFAIAKVRAASASGDALFANCIAFAPDAVAALLALGDGDSIALAGEFTPQGLDRPQRGGSRRPGRGGACGGDAIPRTTQAPDRAAGAER